MARKPKTFVIHPKENVNDIVENPAPCILHEKRKY